MTVPEGLYENEYMFTVMFRKSYLGEVVDKTNMVRNGKAVTISHQMPIGSRWRNSDDEEMVILFASITNDTWQQLTKLVIPVSISSLAPVRITFENCLTRHDQVTSVVIDPCWAHPCILEKNRFYGLTITIDNRNTSIIPIGTPGYKIALLIRYLDRRIAYIHHVDVMNRRGNFIILTSLLKVNETLGRRENAFFEVAVVTEPLYISQACFTAAVKTKWR